MRIPPGHRTRLRSGHRALFALLFVACCAHADPDATDINEGELHFLTKPPADPPYLQSSHATIGEESLASGWVSVKQCHYHLDRVPAMQVVFDKERVRNLEILQADHIGRAWIEDASVQLTDVGADAVLCIGSENKSLRRNARDGSVEWHGGPYMRRFLDGYFPMQVRLVLDYPANRLQLTRLEPAVLKLKAVTVTGQIRLDVLFEGRLDIVATFHPLPDHTGIGW